MTSPVASRYLIGIDLGTTNSVVAYHRYAKRGLIRSPAGRRCSLRHSRLRDPCLRSSAVGGARRSPHALRAPIIPLLSHGRRVVLRGRQRHLGRRPADGHGPARTRARRACPGPASILGQVVALPPRSQSPSQDSARASRAAAAHDLPGRGLRALPDASARRLEWRNGTAAETRFEQQEIVLTVPASFDEEARELTVEAARIAGLVISPCWKNRWPRSMRGWNAWPFKSLVAHLPALAMWSGSRGRARCNSGEELRDGELILICDIGGGTTDFSLVRASLVDGELQFERTAIGEHILLGGDNLDLALAHLVEERNSRTPSSPCVSATPCAAACCAAKERLLSDAALPQLPVTVLGSGHAVIGQALSVELTREEVLQILYTGFLPITAPDEMPSRARPTGLRELGLPFAADPAITRHLAAFLTQAAIAMNAARPHGATRCRALQRRILHAHIHSRAHRRGDLHLVWRRTSRKADGVPSCSITQRRKVRWLAEPPITAACGAVPARA